MTIPLSNDIIETDNAMLTKKVSDKEIYEATKQIHPLKAPDPSGMEAIF